MKLQMTSDLRYAEKALPARVRKIIERQQERADTICKTTAATLSI